MRVYSMMIHKAVEFATLAHSGQVRKGSNVAYIAHPFEVSQILTSQECSEETVIAGLLHDTVEDTEVSFEEIEAEFGARVVELVRICSEDKANSWEDRKENALNQILNCEDEEVLLLKLADKLSNMRSIYFDWKIIGDEVFDRFNRGKDKQRWYYNKLAEVFGRKLKNNPLSAEFVELVDIVFREL